mmetsp:Transcript_375/g.324  ORF Transcript_375/g.324 Transcript_375/m.324 type:complete len:124 (-) Transcript_375:2079-2450(-)
MQELFEMPNPHLENKVFCILKKYHGNDDLGRRGDIFSSPRLSQLQPLSGGDNSFKYVQIKKQSFEGTNGVAMHDVLQIVDISDQILCDKATAEKKLLVLINATVSHEMRNPTNSIYCQNLHQK